MNTNGNEPVHPVKTGGFPTDPQYHGSMERRYFAAMAMQGMLSGAMVMGPREYANIAKWSVGQADALIAALNEGKEAGNEQV